MLFLLKPHSQSSRSPDLFLPPLSPLICFNIFIIVQLFGNKNKKQKSLLKGIFEKEIKLYNKKWVAVEKSHNLGHRHTKKKIEEERKNRRELLHQADKIIIFFFKSDKVYLFSIVFISPCCWRTFPWGRETKQAMTECCHHHSKWTNWFSIGTLSSNKRQQ